MNSATFKVKAREDIVSNGRIIYKAGEVIKQKIGGKIYDSFTTSADNIVETTPSRKNQDIPVAREHPLEDVAIFNPSHFS